MLPFHLVLIFKASEKSVRTIYDGKKCFPPQVTNPSTKIGARLRSAI